MFLEDCMQKWKRLICANCTTEKNLKRILQQGMYSISAFLITVIKTWSSKNLNNQNAFDSPLSSREVEF